MLAWNTDHEAGPLLPEAQLGWRWFGRLDVFRRLVPSCLAARGALTCVSAAFHATSGLPLYAAAKAGVVGKLDSNASVEVRFSNRAHVIGMMRSLSITSQVTSAGIGVAAIVPAFTLTQYALQRTDHGL
jgi:NAD(P)-dependent dehydrogenase (short-subunit alcohol dehydrogenase family)